MLPPQVRLTLLLLCIAMTSACGQTGDLYLPEPEPAPESENGEKRL